MKARSRMLLAALATTVASLALAAPAFAATDDGEGLVGETDDKIVTFVSLGVLLFFVFFVVIATIIQSRLERRKDAAKAARMQQRIGW
jgi:nitrogen fixation/metabolism regulation signal transduction histidine kinase